MEEIKRTLSFAFAVMLLLSLMGCNESEIDGNLSLPHSASADDVTTESINDITLPSAQDSEAVNDPPDIYESNETSSIPAERSLPSTCEISLSDIPSYNSHGAYVAINDNIPFFTDADFTTVSYEHYSLLDSLGRCGVACANIGLEIMPTEERGSIGQVKPSGWQTIKYDSVDGKYLYNRCHLIGYQLSSENANVKNLITGTRYLNMDGMLPFENMVADYVKETNNHVLYRATPMFEGNNLVATGVLLEGISVEDKGDSICFNVFCYNVQPGIVIDYSNGNSELDGTATSELQTDTRGLPASQTPIQRAEQSVGTTYILNTNSHKFHYPSCSSVDQMKESNKQEYTGRRDDLIEQGYSPCGRCNP